MFDNVVKDIEKYIKPFNENEEKKKSNTSEDDTLNSTLGKLVIDSNEGIPIDELANELNDKDELTFNKSIDDILSENVANEFKNTFIPSKDLLEAIIETNNSEPICLKCGGLGRTKNSPFVCPECGKKFVGEVIQESTDEDDNPLILTRKYLENGDWDLLKVSKVSIENSKFFGFLKDLVDNFNYKLGVIDTLVFYVKPGIGMRTWAYTMLKRAKSQGARVSKVLQVPDILEEKSILDKSCDVLVLILPRYRLEESVKFLEYLTYKRETEGKVTIILTTVPKVIINRESDDLASKAGSAYDEGAKYE